MDKNLGQIFQKIKELTKNDPEKFADSNKKAFNFSHALAKKGYSEDGQQLVNDALALAYTVHIKEERPGGLPYINHILNVAKTVLNMLANPDKDLIIAALLHDSVEDQSKKLDNLNKKYKPNLSNRKNALDEIKQKYGERVSKTVAGLSNPDFDSILQKQGVSEGDPNYNKLKNKLYAEHIKEEIKDPDTLVIKLADFADNALNLDDLLEKTKEQKEEKERLKNKYLPVIQIFEDRLTKDNLFPSMQIKLKNAKRVLSAKKIIRLLLLTI